MVAEHGNRIPYSRRPLTNASDRNDRSRVGNAQSTCGCGSCICARSLLAGVCIVGFANVDRNPTLIMARIDLFRFDARVPDAFRRNNVSFEIERQRRIDLIARFLPYGSPNSFEIIEQPVLGVFEP